MTLDPEDFLDTPTDDLPDEVVIPAGTWTLKGKAITSKEDALILTAELGDPDEDVDPDEFDLWEVDRDDDAVAFIRFRGKAKAQQAQVKRVLRDLRLAKPRDLIGAEFKAELKYDPNKNDPGRPWPRWRVLPVTAGTDLVVED